MEIQSLSVVVPGGCPNKCAFCVAHMHRADYENQIEKNLRFQDLYEKDFADRLAFARDNGCNTVVLTGDGEPLCNTSFLKMFAHINSSLASPFRWIDIQTSGVGLDEEKIRFLRNTVRVSTVALSISSFDNEQNALYSGTPADRMVDIKKTADLVKRYDCNLRISLNMTDAFNDKPVQYAFNALRFLNADQVTFRRLFAEGDGQEARWVREHSLDKNRQDAIEGYVRAEGTALERLSFGATRYDVGGVSTVVDTDCMPQDVTASVRYLILRPDCKLYTRWDRKGSKLF